MAIGSLQLPKPVRRRPPVIVRDHLRRDRALELFDGGDVAGALTESLRFLLPSIEVPDLRTEALELVQGTAQVCLRIDGDALLIEAQLARMAKPEKSAAMLRYALTQLASTGQLYQPKLHNSVLSLSYREELTLVHPNKLIEILTRLPSEAESHDDWLGHAFGVETAQRAVLEPLSADELARAEQIHEAHWSAIEALQLESRRRRSVRFMDAVAFLASNHPRYLLPMHGAMRATLNEAAEVFNDREHNPNKRDAELARCVREMRAISPQQLAASLGHAHYALSPLGEGTGAQLASMLGSNNHMQKTGELRASGQALDAAMDLIADYVYLLAQWRFADEVEEAVRTALDQADGRPWREVADLLWNHAAGLVKRYGSEATDTEAEVLSHAGGHSHMVAAA